MTWRVELDDCVELMRAMPDASVDAIVTDPPYGLGREPDAAEVLRHWLAGDDYQHRGGGFMGQSWDSFVPGPAVWREALRVLKPGGHLLAFFGTRTMDLGSMAIRLAGFEIRDTLAWMYGNGFPKSLDVSKAIDKAAGAEREVVGYDASRARPNRLYEAGAIGNIGGTGSVSDRTDNGATITAPATAEAKEWEGWGTALKPALEPIVVARKPLSGTVAATVLEHGTGALNIDGCRIGLDGGTAGATRRTMPGNALAGSVDGALNGKAGRPVAGLGRWPANVVLDEEAAASLDEQTGVLTSGANPTRRGSDNVRGSYGDFQGQEACTPARGADSGGASRFFYVAKASTAERNAGLEGFARQQPPGWSSGEANPGAFQDGETAPRANVHPTVKPIDLMRWLVRLVTPPGGTVLDPFAGSGTTGCAAVLEGFDFVGVERDPEYLPLAEARIAWWAAQPPGIDVDDAIASDIARRKVADTGQSALDLFGGAA